MAQFVDVSINFVKTSRFLTLLQVFMRIKKEESAVMIIDMQEKLFPHMAGKDALLDNIQRLIRGIRILEIPLLLTEQYSKGLGKTILPVKDLINDIEPIEKISFSCCDESRVMNLLHQLNRKFIIIGGIESHVCVLQTVLDLIDLGYIPVVVADCISSRKDPDKKIALERFKTEGAIITSVESILLELCRLAGNEKFKSISALIK